MTMTTTRARPAAVSAYQLVDCGNCPDKMKVGAFTRGPYLCRVCVKLATEIIHGRVRSAGYRLASVEARVMANAFWLRNRGAQTALRAQRQGVAG